MSWGGVGAGGQKRPWAVPPRWVPAADRRRVATVEVLAFAEAMGIRWLLMVLLGASPPCQRNWPNSAVQTSTPTPVRFRRG
ncbi:hypothetical protein GGE06_003087 [Streptomyces sp. SFB5A]|jgi:hypothetical protein|uniref:Uncharacterized protein n=1 Tax=Streptomyces nymphaeiformis TaxID=2663842 RepID=A0A7W7TZC7_9ACTN|nr:hypothetical protein [Streptomyces nymphaeiformis]